MLNFPMQGALDQNAQQADEGYYALLRQMAGMPSLGAGQQAQMQMNPWTMLLGGGLAGLVGGADGAGQFLQGSLQGGAYKQQQEQIRMDREMQKQKMAQDREMGMLKTEAEIANEKANRAHQRAGQFRTDVQNEKKYQRDVAKQNEQTWAGYQTGFRAGGSRDEKIHYARMLAGTPRAISPEELKAGIRSVAEPRIKGYKQEILRWKNTFDLNAEDRQMLEDERAAIFRDFPEAQLGERDVPGVPTSETIRKQKMDEQKRQFTESHTLAKKRFDETAKMNKWRKETVFPKMMEARWASIEVARQQAITSAQNSDYNGGRFWLQQQDTLGGNMIGELEKKVRELEIQRAGEAAKVKYVVQDGQRVAKMDDKAVIAIKEIDGKMTYLNGLIEEQNRMRVESGLPPVEIAQRAPQVSQALQGGIGVRRSSSSKPPSQTKKPPIASKAEALRKKYGY